MLLSYQMGARPANRSLLWPNDRAGPDQSVNAVRTGNNLSCLFLRCNIAGTSVWSNGRKPVGLRKSAGGAVQRSLQSMRRLTIQKLRKMNRSRAATSNSNRLVSGPSSACRSAEAA